MNKVSVEPPVYLVSAANRFQVGDVIECVAPGQTCIRVGEVFLIVRPRDVTMMVNLASGDLFDTGDQDDRYRLARKVTIERQLPQ